MDLASFAERLTRTASSLSATSLRPRVEAVVAQVNQDLRTQRYGVQYQIRTNGHKLEIRPVGKTRQFAGAQRILKARTRNLGPELKRLIEAQIERAMS